MTRLSFRLLAFNLLLVFIPAAGMLYLDVYERQLLEAQERSMVQQGRVLAAALSDQGPPAAALVHPILVRLNRRIDSRIRVVDRGGRVVADTSLLGPRPRPQPAAAPLSLEPARRSLLYRAGARLYSAYRRLLAAPEVSVEPREPAAPDGSLRGKEIEAALAGRYGRAVRGSGRGQRSVTLYCAIPITDGGEPAGAVLVSQSTFRILQDLYAVRLGVFRICLASLAAAVAISLFVSTTIARPLRALRDQAAAIVDRRGRLKGSFRGSRRRDEIGELSRALEELTRRVEERSRFIETFAADLSHELKNPLASIRAAIETLSETEDPAARRSFVAMAQGEIARLERLLSDLREMTSIDARLESEDQAPVSLNALLSRVCEGFRLREPRLRFALDLSSQELTVRASADRLAQVFDNILENAASFSPDGATVRVTLAREDGAAVTTIADEGPGIPAAHRSRIFDRFFSYRPSETALPRRHSGLGLSIVQRIVEGYGGAVSAGNGDRGAVVTVRLPAWRTGVFAKLGER